MSENRYVTEESLIRVSEVRYITREAAAKGRTQISLKGKLRTILIPGQLCRKLQKYARKKGIGSGELFLTTGGRRLDRRQIWAKMKALCGAAGVVFCGRKLYKSR